MPAIHAPPMFRAVFDERARLHAALSRLWVMHRRFVDELQRAVVRDDSGREENAHRKLGKCERYIVRFELRLSVLMFVLSS